MHLKFQYMAHRVPQLQTSLPCFVRERLNEVAREEVTPQRRGYASERAIRIWRTSQRIRRFRPKLIEHKSDTVRHQSGRSDTELGRMSGPSCSPTAGCRIENVFNFSAVREHLYWHSIFEQLSIPTLLAVLSAFFYEERSRGCAHTAVD